MNNSSDLLKSMFGAPRFTPAFIALFGAGLLLLFVGELPSELKSYLIPSLVLYALGASLIGTLHRQIGSFYHTTEAVKEMEAIFRKQGIDAEQKKLLAAQIQNETFIDRKLRNLIIGLHLLWITAFIFYNFWRCAL